MDDEQFFRRHRDAVYRVFANKVDAPADADDLIQNTFVRFFAADRGRMRHPERYLLRIAHNLLREHWRRRGGVRTAGGLAGRSIADLATGASTMVARSERHRILLEGLRHLRLEHQAALELHYWGGLKYREIADVLDVPEGTVATMIGAGKRALRRYVDAALRGPADLETELPQGGPARGLGDPAQV